MKKKLLSVLAVCSILFGFVIEPQLIMAGGGQQNIKAAEKTALPETTKAKSIKGKVVPPQRPKAEVKRKEIEIKAKKIEKNENNAPVFYVRIKNNGKGLLRKVVYYYKITKYRKNDEEATGGSISGPAVTGPETGTETGTDAGTETGAETGAETGTDAGTETGAETGTDEGASPSGIGDGTKAGSFTSNGNRKSTVKLIAKNIKPGKVSGWVSCRADSSGKLSDMKPFKVEIYSGTAKYIYNFNTGNSRIKWRYKDKKEPVIYGWVEKDSYANSDVFLVCYTDRKDSYNFKKYVWAVDNRDGTVKIEADTSRIDWTREGVYKVIYRARDKAGNVAKSWAKVRVYKPGITESAADDILRRITNASDSQETKARKIYSYVRENCAYIDSGSHADWRKVALNGFRYNSGDCYTHYAMTRALLCRAGIPNIEISRYPHTSGNRHWWNLVYVHDGWYHLDTTKRLSGGEFCLMTDAQLWGYREYGGTPFLFETGKYPKRADKVISPNP